MMERIIKTPNIVQMQYNYNDNTYTPVISNPLSYTNNYNNKHNIVFRKNNQKTILENNNIANTNETNVFPYVLQTYVGGLSLIAVYFIYKLTQK